MWDSRKLNLALRLSEKVPEQRSEGRYGRCTEREKDLRVVCSATLQAPPTLFGPNLAAMSGTHGGTRNGHESQVKASFFTRGEGGCGARFRRLG